MKLNLTPVIDVVFLLIIFFLLVCQFIVAENFEVTVPDDISTAVAATDRGRQIATVTVMFDENEQIVYAVGSEKIEALGAGAITEAIAAQIDSQLRNLPTESRVVCLRMDRQVPYLHGQYALAGISQSTATEIKLAVTKQKQIR